MDEPRKHQVSLRGASAKEITREALLEKVSREREIRNYARRSNAAAILIQRVLRSYLDAKMTSSRLLDEWELLLKQYDGELSSTWISITVLRPFLLFSVHLLRLRSDRSIRIRILDSAQICFTILLESMNRPDIQGNFCSLAIGTPEERRIWNFQARKLISLCFYLLSEFNLLNSRGPGIVGVTSQAMRLAVVLTDCKGWKIISDANRSHAENAVNDLISFMGSSNCAMYRCIGRYVSRLDASSSNAKKIVPTDEKFFITASAMTLALRPFYVTKCNESGSAQLGMDHAAEQYFVFLLTIPRLTQRLPTVLVPALKHNSTLSPCFQTLLISKEKILTEMEQSKSLYDSGSIPPVGWALANVICLATMSESDSINHGCFNQSIHYTSYVHVVTILAESLLAYLDIKCMRTQKKISLHGDESEIVSSTPESPTPDPIESILLEKEGVNGSLNMSFVDLCRPVCQQWHLTKLLDIANNGSNKKSEAQLQDDLQDLRKLELHDVALFYSVMLRIFSILHPTLGSLPVLNMLSFTPGFLFNIWQELEAFIFPANSQMTEDHSHMHQLQGNIKNTVVEKKPKQVGKDGVNKWASVLHRLTGKPHADIENTTTVDNKPGPSNAVEESTDVWDVEAVKCGLQGISKDILCMLHLFCSAYSHLLLVLDDIEFYEKQIPFKLEQQRRIAAMLNTLVYNGLLSHGNDQHQSLVDSAIRCLHLMYERDCRHQFCPPGLWLSPARKSRPPIAVAARTHGLLSTNTRPEEALTTPSMGSVITTTPHVFPFEERVEMFREFIKMDKASRKMAGEILEPGSRSIEVVVRRGHIVEDGFRQLNPLGSRLKSSIHISFVSECGLPEAGLDYGGLSKEFLTDLSKTAFAPEYGLFSQTSSSDRLLIPNPSARYLENGIQMIEFLGRVVGKALYEGILLDYSFSHVFVQKLLGRYSFLDELSTLDPELYRNLMYVKYYDGDVTDLALDFTVTGESFGKRHIIELKTGGKDVSVTNENKMQYIHAIADYKLNQQILPFSNAFYRGLTDLISVSWLRLFNASEFNQLLSGGNYDIDVDDLKANTRYTGGYNESSRTIKIFWEVIRNFEPKERCLLLKFVTSCSRAPLLGFKHLQPSFTIHKVACDIPLWATFGGQDVERLPSASTCYNTLKLPTYKRPSTLRSKLLYAINSNAGFELS